MLPKNNTHTKKTTKKQKQAENKGFLSGHFKLSKEKKIHTKCVANPLENIQKKKHKARNHWKIRYIFLRIVTLFEHVNSSAKSTLKKNREKKMNQLILQSHSVTTKRKKIREHTKQSSMWCWNSTWELVVNSFLTAIIFKGQSTDIRILKLF